MVFWIKKSVRCLRISLKNWLCIPVIAGWNEGPAATLHKREQTHSGHRGRGKQQHCVPAVDLQSPEESVRKSNTLGTGSASVGCLSVGMGDSEMNKMQSLLSGSTCSLRQTRKYIHAIYHERGETAVERSADLSEADF